MKGGKRDKMYYKWRDCSLNFQPECYFMTDFVGSTKAQLEVAIHQNIRRGERRWSSETRDSSFFSQLPQRRIFFLKFRSDEELNHLLQELQN